MDHDYTLPKPPKIYSFRIIPSDDFLPIHKKVLSNPNIIFQKTNKSLPFRHPVKYVPRSLFVDGKAQSPGGMMTKARQNVPNVQVRLAGAAVTAKLQAALPHKFLNPLNSINTVVQNRDYLSRRPAAGPHQIQNKGPILKNRATRVGVIQANQNLQRKASGIGETQKPIDLSGTGLQVPKRNQPVERPVIASLPPLVKLNSASPTNGPAAQQSPLQQRMRTFMDHLHLLQNQMNTTDGANSVNKVSGSSLTTQAKSPLNAARNLSNFPKTKTNGSVVRLIGPPPQVNGKTLTLGQAMKINGIPVTKLSHMPTNTLRPNPTSLGMRKVIVSQKNDSSPKGSQVHTKKPSIRIVTVDPQGNLMQKNVANSNTNVNRLTNAAATSPSKIRHGANFKTYPAKKDRVSSLPPLVPLSKANKENIKKRRLSLRGVNHNKVAASIDLSTDDDSGSASGVPLSQEVVNTLKRKGVSINYVGDKSSNDVIKLD